MKLIDISNKRFGRLTVIEKHQLPKMWRCICDCNTETLVSGTNLRNGSTKSCGCLLLEWSRKMGSDKLFIKQRAALITKHGHKRRGMMTKEYATWLRMKERCYDESSKDWGNWGGRGIKVCDRWVRSFENFLLDMGERPSGNYSIDRLDPNKDYSPENCRWATMSQQGAENRRSLIPVSYMGVEYSSIASACRSLMLKYTTIMYRVTQGVSISDALNAGVNRLQKKRTRESYIKKSLRSGI